MTWDGAVVIWPRRILFAGEAGKSKAHNSHTLMICAAYNGAFDIHLDEPGAGTESYSAALIEPGTQHSMKGGGAEFLALMYLLPESQAARELRRRYLTGRRVCRIPDETAEKLQPLLKRISDYWRLDCARAGRFFEGVLDELIDLPPERRDEFDGAVHNQVRCAIEEIYKRMEMLLHGAPLTKEDFTSDAVAEAIEMGIREPGEALRRKFRESTGETFNHYVRLLRFRATLVKLALDEAELRERMSSKGLAAGAGAEEGAGRAQGTGGMSVAERKRARRISLTEAAAMLGWGKVYNLNHASTDIIGISPNSLRLDSHFVACGGNA